MVQITSTPAQFSNDRIQPVIAVGPTGDYDTSSVPVRDGGSAYQVVAISQTNKSLGVTGGINDVLASITINPGATPTDVVIKDGTTLILTIPAAIQTANKPETYFFGWLATVAWKVTTGTGTPIIASGTFTP